MSDAPPGPLPARVSGVAIATAAIGLLLTASPLVALVLPEAIAVVFPLPFVGLWLTQIAKRHIRSSGRPDAAARIAAPAERVIRVQMRLALWAIPVVVVLAGLMTVNGPII